MEIFATKRTIVIRFTRVNKLYMSNHLHVYIYICCISETNEIFHADCNFKNFNFFKKDT